MSCDRCSLVLACVALAMSLALSVSAVPTGSLKDLAENSICKSEIKYNVNEERIPRIIKEVKCAADPNVMCPVGDKEVPCCERNYRNMGFSCQEMKDTVLVSYGGSDTVEEQVSVGCSCIMHQVTTARDAGR